MRRNKIMEALIKRLEQKQEDKEFQQQEEIGAVRLLKDIFNDERKRIEW